MDNHLMDKKLNEDCFDEYIEKILNIFRLSSKESSILLDIKIQNYQVTIDLSIVNQAGKKEEFNDVILNCDTVFYQKFLIPLVVKMDSTVEIKTKDVVHLSENELVTFRMITENNDLFTVDGLSLEDANHLLDVVKDEKEDKKLIVSNNEGTGNACALILMLSILMGVLAVIIRCM